MHLLQYEFMRRAYLVGFLLSAVIPCIGIIVVNKRSSMIGDALSHVSLAGVAMGLILGINPIIGSIIVCCIAALSMEVVRKNFPQGSDIATALVMSTGIGLAAVLSDFVPGVANFESFLFGSIVAITDFELYLVIILSLVVLFSFFKLYNGLLYISFDETGARLAGIPTERINFFFTLLIALIISIASRTVGVLIISSLMVIPVATAIRISKSYRQTVYLSVIFGIFFTLTGITLSFYYGLKPGGTIVLIGIISFFIVLSVKNILSRYF